MNPSNETGDKPKIFLLFCLIYILFLALSRHIPGFPEVIANPRTRRSFDLVWIGLLLWQMLQGLLTRTIPQEGVLGERQRETVRKLEWRLFTWNMLAIVTLCVLIIGFRMERTFAFSTWMFLLIYWLIYEPLLNSKNPGRKSIWKLPVRTRIAGLKPRNVENPVPTWCWGVVWVVWFLVALVAYMDIQRTLRFNPFKWSHIEDALACLSLSAGALLVGPLMLRWWIRRPEPMVDHNLEKLTNAYEDLRRFKAWAAYYMALSIAIPFLLFLFVDSIGGKESFVLPLVLFGPALTIGPLLVSFHQRRTAISDMLNEPEEAPPGEAQATH